MLSVTIEKEFIAESGVRWRVAYTDAGIRGLVTMQQVAFTALDGENTGEERYLTVFNGYLEKADDHQLSVALSQAQPVNPPW